MSVIRTIDPEVDHGFATARTLSSGFVQTGQGVVPISFVAANPSWFQVTVSSRSFLWLIAIDPRWSYWIVSSHGFCHQPTSLWSVRSFDISGRRMRASWWEDLGADLGKVGTCQFFIQVDVSDNIWPSDHALNLTPWHCCTFACPLWSRSTWSKCVKHVPISSWKASSNSPQV